MLLHRYTHSFMCIHTHTHAHTFIHLFTFSHVHILLQVYMHALMYALKHIYTHAHTFSPICVHTCSHVHTHPCVQIRTCLWPPQLFTPRCFRVHLTDPLLFLLTHLALPHGSGLASVDKNLLNDKWPVHSPLLTLKMQPTCASCEKENTDHTHHEFISFMGGMREANW